MPHWVLYGMPGSLYTAKARSYLRKQGLAYEERVPGDPRFGAEILPVTGRWIIPVMQSPAGEIIQDGADIIDHVEQHGAATRTAYPSDPVERTVAHLFDLFGGEGMLRPAMHYRWNFDADNLAFLERDFVRALDPSADDQTRAQVFGFSSGRMRAAARSFGVNPATCPAIEAAYLDLLARLDAHFEHYPYLLGDEPSLGDYGLIGPLHAHLSRDPHPSHLMKTRAVNVWRWVERMTTEDDFAGEYAARPATATAALQSRTLASLMAFVAQDYLADITAQVEYVRAWLPNQDETQLVTQPIERGIGRAALNWRGHEIEIGVVPYRLWMLQRMQDAAAKLSAPEASRLEALLQPAGLAPLLTLNAGRRIARRQNREWWV